MSSILEEFIKNRLSNVLSRHPDTHIMINYEKTRVFYKNVPCSSGVVHVGGPFDVVRLSILHTDFSRKLNMCTKTENTRNMINYFHERHNDHTRNV